MKRRKKWTQVGALRYERVTVKSVFMDDFFSDVFHGRKVELYARKLHPANSVKSLIS